MNNQLHIGILAAGKGSRMESELPKVLHQLNGKSLIDYVLDTASELNPDSITLVVGFQKDRVKNHIQNNNVNYVSQEEQLGTGHAALQLENQLENQSGHLLILYGDAPNIKSSTLSPIINEHIEENRTATLITATLNDPTGYGRIIRNQDGDLLKIVEEKDCTPDEKKIKEWNPGIYIFKIPQLFSELKRIKSNNASNEYYLTDVIELIKENSPVQAKKIDNPMEVIGINTINQLNSLENS
ncbi:MAG TPA: sugar phosphate nucleotidyltransferase [Candidatus Marinimicrobia bacterium]|nr:sugar phosphate nucleotidyltransferase [Candidatus Neomarinimicrobiota bacterium]|tara:strand:- start:1436 stop:2158 length:723 start_codon:yes stop_codon:yes gene_type:complete